MGNCDRLCEQWFRCGKPHRQMRTVPLHLCKDIVPAISLACQISLLNHPAEVCYSTFNRLDSCVASGIKHQLRGPLQLAGLPGREAVIHLKGDPPLRIVRTSEATEVLLAGRKKGRFSFIGGAIVKRSSPHAAWRA